MRPLPLVTVATVIAMSGCSDLEPPHGRSSIEMNATSYVATSSKVGAFDYEVTVVARIKNNGEDNVRLWGCTTQDIVPQYYVEPKDQGRAAWDPIRTCGLPGGTGSLSSYRDLGPGQTVVDTLVLRAPWFRTVTGEPVGDIEGSFFLVYETYPCAVVNRFGYCYGSSSVEYARSNSFTIRK